ncbi:MAG: hypothetical protein DSZ06_02660 [Sulfurospirillum sp.]|nr:MAG: hypothetical protein DSZ06_02660 [Sulfurospirillum sp.]
MIILGKSQKFVVILALFFSTFLIAADSAGISGTVTTLPESSQTSSALLKKDWNLVGINSLLTLDELKSKMGEDNLLIISGKTTYKKSNVDNGKAFLNDFKKFEKGQGYWIKLSHDKKIDFKLNYDVSEISLKKDWNLINPPKELTLEQIKQRVGADNLLIISGATTYKKSNVDNGKAFLNDFTHFEEPQGYWIKVAHDVVLKF